MNRNKKVVARMTVTSAVLVMTTITALGGSTEDGKGNVTGSVTPGKKGMAGVIAELQDAEVPSYNAQAEGTKNKQNGTVSLGGGEIENAGISAGVAKLAGLAAEEVVRSAEENGQEYIVAESLPVREDGHLREIAVFVGNGGVIESDPVPPVALHQGGIQVVLILIAEVPLLQRVPDNEPGNLVRQDGVVPHRQVPQAQEIHF